MTLVGESHADLGATFAERGGREVVANYGRPERTARAVRNGVGAIEMGYGVVVVAGDDRIDFVDNAVTNRVPAADGEGCYALLLDPQGRIETDLAVFNAGERLLVFTPPDRAEPLVEDWSAKTFVQDVDIRDATGEFGVFGVHGPSATEKVASVLHGAGAPEGTFSFVRGSMGDAGVTVVATDAPCGEESYEVVCTAADAPEVWDTLLTRGNGAAPFGYDTWDALTLEAGTPQFHAEMEGNLPNVVGLRTALDFEKGCYVGQEVVSKVENRGRPSRRLVGLRPDDDGWDVLPEPGLAVTAGGDEVGSVTRAADCPSLDGPAALAFVDFDTDADTFALGSDDGVTAERASLPFVSGSATSGRLPEY